MAVLHKDVVDTQRKSYVPVPMEVILPDRPLGFSLYVRQKGDAIALACRCGESVSEARLKSWHTNGLRVLYVDTAEHRLYQKYAESAMDELLSREDVPTTRKAEICYQTTRELVRDAVETSHIESVVGERREKWVSNLVSLICSDDSAIDGMLSMLSHDYYTYTHMVNVSVMVTSLAYRIGQQDPEQLKRLASGGLLHDVGKLRINPDTLNKVGRLSGEEWEELRSHPDLGLGFLHGRADIKPVELLMVHQHHEKLDGSGYPLGLVRSEISPEAQMTAVVDIYDALTCKRPYRNAMKQEKAMAILDGEAGAKLNPDMLAAWKEITDKVPTAGEQA